MTKKKYDTKKIMIIVTIAFLTLYYVFKGKDNIELWKFLFFAGLMIFGIYTTDLDEVKKGVSERMKK